MSNKNRPTFKNKKTNFFINKISKIKPNYKVLDKDTLVFTEIFSRVLIFEKVNKHEGLIAMAKTGRMLEYPPHSTIVTESNTGNTAFIVLEGNIEILRKSLLGDDFVVATLGVDKLTKYYPFIGEQSLISKQSRTATVRTLSTVRVLELHHDAFIQTAEKYPKVGMHIYQALCTILQTRLSNANKNVVALFEAYMDTMAEDFMESSRTNVDILY